LTADHASGEQILHPRAGSQTTHTQNTKTSTRHENFNWQQKSSRSILNITM